MALPDDVMEQLESNLSETTGPHYVPMNLPQVDTAIMDITANPHNRLKDHICNPLPTQWILADWISHNICGYIYMFSTIRKLKKNERHTIALGNEQYIIPKGIGTVKVQVNVNGTEETTITIENVYYCPARFNIISHTAWKFQFANYNRVMRDKHKLIYNGQEIPHETTENGYFRLPFQTIPPDQILTDNEFDEYLHKDHVNLLRHLRFAHLPGFLKNITSSHHPFRFINSDPGADCWFCKVHPYGKPIKYSNPSLINNVAVTGDCFYVTAKETHYTLDVDSSQQVLSSVNYDICVTVQHIETGFLMGFASSKDDVESPFTDLLNFISMKFRVTPYLYCSDKNESLYFNTLENISCDIQPMLQKVKSVDMLETSMDNTSFFEKRITQLLPDAHMYSKNVFNVAITMYNFTTTIDQGNNNEQMQNIKLPSIGCLALIHGYAGNPILCRAVGFDQQNDKYYFIGIQDHKIYPKESSNIIFLEEAQLYDNDIYVTDPYIKTTEFEFSCITATATVSSQADLSIREQKQIIDELKEILPFDYETLAECFLKYQHTLTQHETEMLGKLITDTSMLPDNPKPELSVRSKYIEAIGLKIRNEFDLYAIDDDMSCLYSSVSFAIYGNILHQNIIRILLVRHIITNIQGLIHSHKYFENASISHLIKIILDKNCRTTDSVKFILSEMLQRPIFDYQLDGRINNPSEVRVYYYNSNTQNETKDPIYLFSCEKHVEPLIRKINISKVLTISKEMSFNLYTMIAQKYIFIEYKPVYTPHKNHLLVGDRELPLKDPIAPECDFRVSCSNCPYNKNDIGKLEAEIKTLQSQIAHRESIKNQIKEQKKKYDDLKKCRDSLYQNYMRHEKAAQNVKDKHFKEQQKSQTKKSNIAAKNAGEIGARNDAADISTSKKNVPTNVDETLQPSTERCAQSSSPKLPGKQSKVVTRLRDQLTHSKETAANQKLQNPNILKTRNISKVADKTKPQQLDKRNQDVAVETPVNIPPNKGITGVEKNAKNMPNNLQTPSVKAARRKASPSSLAPIPSKRNRLEKKRQKCVFCLRHMNGRSELQEHILQHHMKQ